MNRVVWLPDVPALIAHNSQRHFVCPFRGCVDSCIAFATRDEYALHMCDAHSDRTCVGSFVVPSPAGQADEEGPGSRDRTIELNRRFMRRLEAIFSERPEVVRQLSARAQALIEGKTSCQAFYAAFGQLCGEHKNAIFVDMVAIMPDPAKRAQLLRLHENMQLPARPPTGSGLARQPRSRKKTRAVPILLI
jgi:hypothetical protein